MDSITSVGFYGKLPMVGDFVSRRLPNDFISSWDSWLQSAIAASREELGDDWLKNYLTSPIWRFLLSPGLCGNQAVAGIMMPSVDRVGRYYPLTVAVQINQSSQLPFLFTSGNAWFEQLEDAAFMALEGNLDINAFDELIQTIPPFSLPASASSDQQQLEDKKSFHITLSDSQQVGDAFIELNANLLASFMPGFSLWNSTGSENVRSELIACQGLPPIASFSGFLKTKDWPMHFAETSNSSDITLKVPEPEPASLSSILGGNNSSEAKLGWRSWAVTDTGKKRKHNEDSFLDRPEAGLWVVADGMGGHKAGDVASQMIVNTLKELAIKTPLVNLIKDVENCLQSVNIQLRQLAAKEYGNHLVGSTVVGLVCDPERCGFLWAGDSRLYRFRHNRLEQLTKDHCAEEEISSGWSVKSSNIITRAIGAYDELELDVQITEMLDGDIFLLSSDGLDKEISFKEIETMIQKTKPHELANALINETLSRGARDNVTVVVVSIETVL
ncbi:MAG: type VI secretion system-associated protein TagF [Methylobacter sp.]|nr:type VI secretion system-associated protein TagF [Methylobacter sp.]